VEAVLDHWAATLYPNAAPKRTLERRKRVRARLREGFTREDLFKAILGARRDDWLMGRDPKARAGGYRDVDTVLRDAAQVERLMALAPVAPPGQLGLAGTTPEPTPMPTDEERRANMRRVAEIVGGLFAPREEAS